MVIGPSRLGKTEWSRSLGRHIYWNAYYSLDQWDRDANYVVIDDVSGLDIKTAHWRALIGGQREFTMTDKYRMKRKVNGGKPCIILCNPDMDFYHNLDSAGRDWFDKNVTRVHIYESLFQ